MGRGGEGEGNECTGIFVVGVVVGEEGVVFGGGELFREVLVFDFGEADHGWCRCGIGGVGRGGEGVLESSVLESQARNFEIT